MNWRKNEGFVFECLAFFYLISINFQSQDRLEETLSCSRRSKRLICGVVESLVFEGREKKSEKRTALVSKFSKIITFLIQYI